ncbi:hypothetical protein M231_03074 [Tremella mesenterica]|uniref:Uncharacterized protein n=1 Tax=Tremella mesenterica TaxID=5217 RepID=A0A4Q1BPA0_TREME|nr:hypothetical protein M231_03074 [Tremella mesenterica]
MWFLKYLFLLPFVLFPTASPIPLDWNKPTESDIPSPLSLQHHYVLFASHLPRFIESNPIDNSFLHGLLDQLHVSWKILMLANEYPNKRAAGQWKRDCLVDKYSLSVSPLAMFPANTMDFCKVFEGY